jgi:NTE family protein
MGADFVIAVDINLRASTLRKTVKLAKKTDPSPRINQLIESLGKLIPQRATSSVHATHRWISPPKSEIADFSIFDVLTRSFRLIENQITRRELALNPPDILIQPEVGEIMTLEFHRGPEAIAAGISAVDEVLPQLTRLLTPHS